MRTQSEHADQPGPHTGLVPGMATCLLLVSLEEALVKAASLRLLIPAGLGAMGQNFVSREEARSATYTSLCGQAVSSCCDCIAFMEHRCRHLCTILFVSYFILPSEEKHDQNQGSPWCSPQVVGI